MKYICVTNWEEDTSFGVTDMNTSDCIITFPDGISHKKMFDSLKLNHDELEAISAGFVIRDKNNRLTCSGRSFSLDLESRGEIDTILLNVNF